MTIRQTPTESAIEACLDFTPVPVKPRFDGWTDERQRGFIAALGRFGTVSAAAAHVAMSKEGAYYLRRRPGAESFARAWGRAIGIGIQSLRDIAYERAVVGTPKGVWHNGERVGEEMVKNDRLLMFMLRHEQPAAYGEAKRLPPGTKHRDTIAREERWADAEDAEMTDLTADEIDGRIDEFVEIYAEKARELAAAQARGDSEEERVLTRQLTLFEIATTVEGGEEFADKHGIDFVTGRFERDGEDGMALFQKLFAEARREARAKVREGE